jgi:hypothetical protein
MRYITAVLARCQALVIRAIRAAVGRTLRISCEAVPPPIQPAGAQGGTSACRTGAALSFVSCIRLFDGLVAPCAVTSMQQHGSSL